MPNLDLPSAALQLACAAVSTGTYKYIFRNYVLILSRLSCQVEIAFRCYLSGAFVAPEKDSFGQKLAGEFTDDWLENSVKPLTKKPEKFRALMKRASEWTRADASQRRKASRGRPARRARQKPVIDADSSPVRS